MKDFRMSATRISNLLFVVVGVSGFLGCGGGGGGGTTMSPPLVTTAPISVSVTPNTANVQVGQQQTFTAIVTNDTAMKGVTWAASCAAANGCGSLSTMTSASGTAIIYTAPPSVPSPAVVTLTATSVTLTAKSASATITISSAAAGVSVALSQTNATVAVNATTTFTATVAGDSSNKGVNWSLACSTSNGCGSLSTTTSASGTPMTYTAPATVPSPATATIVATSVTDPTKSASASITITPVSTTISGVTVTCAPSSISAGSTSTCSAVVAGSNSPSQSVTWASSAGTVSPTGVFTAPAVTSQTNVTVTATSVADPSKSGTFTVAVSVPVAMNTPIFVGPGQLGGLTVNGNDPLIAVNDVDVYSANDQTTATLHGEVTAMVGPDVLSLTPTNQVWLDGVLQTSITTDLPPTLYKGQPVWFDMVGNVQTPLGTLYAPTAGQDGIDLEANGRLIAWVENVSATECDLYVSVSLAAPQVISTQGCVTWPDPVDANGNLYVLYQDAVGLHDAVSVDNGASWTTNDIPFSPETLQLPSVVFPSMAANPNGTLYAVWEQRGDPNTSDDVRQCWMSLNSGNGWVTQADPLPPGGDAALGNFNPVVVSDGSEALLSGEKFGVWLNSTQIVSSLTAGAPLLALLPDGTRAIAWGDTQGVWFEEVPK